VADEVPSPGWRAAITLPVDQVPLFDDAMADKNDGASIFEVPNSDDWIIEAYFINEPDRAMLEARLAIIATAHNVDTPILDLAQLPDEDWVQKSLTGLVPVEAGRFFVYGSHNEEMPPANSIRILIEAGPAFGTGQHETTKGCLLAIDEICQNQKPIQNPLDVGTGTGVLAIAVAKALGIAVTASDIDPVSVAEAQENAGKNEVGALMHCVQANGLAEQKLWDGAPYDLLIANILANPLIAMAPDIINVVDKNGWIILSGLLEKQRQSVLDAYLPLGVELAGQHQLGEWPTLVLKKR
jgi:ribosomal protein L11 methyltransferase